MKGMQRHVRAFIFLFIATLVGTVSGCGYRPTGAGEHLTGPDREIGIPVVVNNSYKPYIETRFTNNLIDEFAGRGFRVVSGTEAPRSLQVTIVSYTSVPVAYNAQDQVRIYRAVMAVEAVLRDNARGVVLWKKRMDWGEEYPASDDIALQSNNEDTAINEAEHRLAQQIHQNMIQDF
jgi:hypothetical protein